MSDTDTTTDTDKPAVMVVANPNGGHIGIMHLGEDIRAFAANSFERLHALVSKVGISEYGLSQQDADQLADQALNQPANAEPPQGDDAKIRELTQQVEHLQAENARLSTLLPQPQGTPPAAPAIPTTPEAWAAIGAASGSSSQDDGTGPSANPTPATPEAWAAIGSNLPGGSNTDDGDQGDDTAPAKEA